MGIEWADFSWEAFATLVTGVLAVGAALAVGRRQTEIQARQISLQEQELKISLLEERLSVYDPVHNFFAAVLTNGKPADGDFQRSFRIAMVKARFLFSDKLNEYLNVIWDRHCDFWLHHTMSNSENNDDEEDRKKNVLLNAEDLKWFSNEFKSLHIGFDEIRPVLEQGRSAMHQPLARDTASAAPIT